MLYKKEEQKNDRNSIYDGTGGSGLFGYCL